MPTMNGLQRVLYQGIPVWKNAENELFAYDTESPPLKLGTSGLILTDWKCLYQARLDAYRQSLVPRPRSQKK